MYRVCTETEGLFNDKFWESKDFIVCAVDSARARHYIDAKCVWLEKPLLEAGIEGVKASSQVIIPRKTTCYGDYQDPH